MRTVDRSWSSTRPRVFIASSSEDLEIARYLHSLIAEFARPRLWTHAFELGQHYLDELLRHARECDFGVFVLDANDVRVKREQASLVPRDNVLYELGIFHGARGKDRAFIIFCSEDPPELPSDLAGVAAGNYRSVGPDELSDALSPVALKVRSAIERLSPISPLARCEDEVRHVMLAAISRMSRTIRGAHSEDIGTHVWWRDIGERRSPERLVRVLRVRPGSSTRNPWAPWEYGVGLIGKSWELDTTVELDLASASIQAVASESDWAALPEGIRLRVSYDGFLLTRRDFRAVWATPIHAQDGEFLGVLAVNLDKDITGPFVELNEIVRPAARELATTIGFLASVR